MDKLGPCPGPEAVVHGDLVDMHLPGGRTILGRYDQRSASGPAVLDLHRSSRADNGWRKVVEGAVVHHARSFTCQPTERRPVGGPERVQCDGSAR